MELFSSLPFSLSLSITQEMMKMKTKKEDVEKSLGVGHHQDISIISPPPPPDVVTDHHCRHFWCSATIICCSATVFLVALSILILTLTVFRPNDPSMTLVSAKVDGVSPSISFTGGVHVNITLDLDLLVHNPNRASFHHERGTTLVEYRGSRVGHAEVAAGRVPERGSEHVLCKVTVLGAGFAGKLDKLVEDVAEGELGFDAESRIRGKVVLFGFVTRNTVVAASRCHVVVGLPDVHVRRQHC